MSNVKNLLQKVHQQSSIPSPTPKMESAERHNFSTTPQLSKEHKSSQKIPTSVSQIAREDVSIDTYGVKPVPTNFNVYNKDVWRWLTDFSSSNQFSGGCPITKSQLIEICLDVIMYDLDIKPIGYQSHQELRKEIQKRIKM